MTDELKTLSDHVLNWILNEEEVSEGFREAIRMELLRRAIPSAADELIELTKENLHEAASSNGGFTAAQVAVFGLRYPLRSGWLQSLVGRKIAFSQYRQFVEAGKPRKKCVKKRA